MTSIPLPPGYKLKEDIKIRDTSCGSTEDNVGCVTPTREKAKDAVVDIDEASLILRTTLHPHHHNDPNVIAFIRNYVHCRSVAQAAKECNLTARDGFNLKRRPDIHEAIVRLTEKAVLKHGIDASEVVERVQEIMRLDPVELENADGTFKESLNDIPPDSRRAIKKFKAKNIYDTDPNGMRVVVGKLIEVEFWDKMKAVELLGREVDLFKETKQIKHDVTKNMSDVLLGARKRADDAVAGMREVGEVIAVEHKTVSDAVGAVEMESGDE